MDAQRMFLTALEYEEKIRDLYRSADGIIDDERGKSIFRALADDEQSHVDFLHYSLEQLDKKQAIDVERLATKIPDTERVQANLEELKKLIPEKMLGDVKTVLNSALQMEKETSAFYRQALNESQGAIKEIFEKFLVIEERHVDMVQLELDHASNSGLWFDFLEVDLEAE